MNMDIIKHKIDFNTAPWEWMSGSVTFGNKGGLRDINSWNKAVDGYKPTVIKIVYKTLEEYLNKG